MSNIKRWMGMVGMVEMVGRVGWGLK